MTMATDATAVTVTVAGVPSGTNPGSVVVAETTATPALTLGAYNSTAKTFTVAPKAAATAGTATFTVTSGSVVTTVTVTLTAP